MTGYPVRLVPSSPVMTGTGAYLVLAHLWSPVLVPYMSITITPFIHLFFFQLFYVSSILYIALENR